MIVHKVEVPRDSMAVGYFDQYDYGDAYSGLFSTPKDISPTDVTKSFFRATPLWLIGLMKIRNLVVKWFGLKTPAIKDIEGALELFDGKVGDSFGGVFRVVGATENEILTAENDKHLDFCLSFLVVKNNSNCQITLTTLVKFKGFLGRLYFFPVKPMHKMIIRVLLKKMMRDLA